MAEPFTFKLHSRVPAVLCFLLNNVATFVCAMAAMPGRDEKSALSKLGELEAFINSLYNDGH